MLTEVLEHETPTVREINAAKAEKVFCENCSIRVMKEVYHDLTASSAHSPYGHVILEPKCPLEWKYRYSS